MGHGACRQGASVLSLIGGRIPVTVLGGYLGAGKTTIVARLLETTTQRIAVLINDFGEVNIDADRIARRSDDVIELTNGCVCCALVDGFIETLERIRAWESPPEHLVIEPSGVADAMAVGQYAHLPGFRLAGVCVAVDVGAPELLEDPKIGPTVRHQIERADLILATKTDLLEPGARESQTEIIRMLTPAPIIRVVNGAVASDVLLGVQTQAVRIDSGLFDEPLPHPPVRSAAVQWRATDRPALERWITMAPASVLRAKGFVPTEPGLGIDVDLVGRRTHVAEIVDVSGADEGTFVVLELAPEDEPDGLSQAVREWLAARPPRSA